MIRLKTKANAFQPGRHMKYLMFALLAFCSMGTTAQPLSMQPLEQERSRFDKAYSALRSGRVGEAKELIEGLEDYPLYPYFQYHRLRPTLHTLSDEAVQQFLAAYNDSLLDEQLRPE